MTSNVTHSVIRLLLRFSSINELIAAEVESDDPIDILTIGRCRRLKLTSRARRPTEEALNAGREAMWLWERSMAAIRSLREDTMSCAAEESSL